MDIVKLKPATKDYIWGGTKLKGWGKASPSESIAECWELSFNPDGPSLIASGKDEGRYLKDVATAADVGPVPSGFPFFPVLIKLIDSADNLSVQVHPSDDYALSHERQYGKTEMWYVIEAEEGAGLYVGFKRKTSAEEVRQAVSDGSIVGLLNFCPVKTGEVYFIPSGTVHAIGKGITLIEIQQNSTLTYRLYDYKRLGKDGKPRELHLDKALLVMDFEPYRPVVFKRPCIGASKYFQTYAYAAKDFSEIIASKESFASLTFVSGEGVFAGMDYRKGDTFFIPCGQKGSLKGNGRFVLTQVGKL
ncbi:MAG: class I mannose-6-phosphate isomerase [Bacilli bacterium]|jgi:mannose-6-phosphate isomerase|nr:class I mannose-6-phosphate isomerase [Bacilli bacterium]